MLKALKLLIIIKLKKIKIEMNKNLILEVRNSLKIESAIDCLSDLNINKEMIAKCYYKK